VVNAFCERFRYNILPPKFLHGNTWSTSILLLPERGKTQPQRTLVEQFQSFSSYFFHILIQLFREHFLSAVSNLGVRLPVERIVRAARATSAVRFVVVDGAQAFCHVPVHLDEGCCDLYLAGCHKWLGACHPLGIAVLGRRESRAFIEAAAAVLVRRGVLDDPLLRFSYQLEAGLLDGTTETVGLAPLFSCQGAATDALGKGPPARAALPCRVRNAAATADLALASGWCPLLPPPESRTGILLLQAERARTRQAGADALRSAFYSRGVALTAYEAGRIRLSMPRRPWRPGEAEHLCRALRAAA